MSPTRRALGAGLCALLGGTVGAQLGLFETQAYALSAALLVGIGARLDGLPWAQFLFPIGLGLLAADLRSAGRNVLLDGLVYLDPAAPMEAMLPVAVRATRGLPALLGGLALGAGLAWPRDRLGTLFGMGALGAGLGALLVGGAEAALRAHDPAAAAQCGLLTLLVGPMVAMLAGLSALERGLAGSARALRLLLALLLGYAVDPPLAVALAALPAAATAQEVPALPARPGVALPAYGPDLAADLRRAGLRPYPEDPLPCRPPDRARWLRAPRQTIALALPATATLARLDEALDAAALFLTHRLALVGRAGPFDGPLGPLLSWPALRLLVERPPAEAVFVPIGAQGQLARPADGAICALLPDPALTVGAFAQAAAAIDRGPCAALILMPVATRPDPADIDAQAAARCPP